MGGKIVPIPILIKIFILNYAALRGLITVAMVVNAF